MHYQVMSYQYVTGSEFQNGCLECLEVGWGVSDSVGTGMYPSWIISVPQHKNSVCDGQSSSLYLIAFINVQVLTYVVLKSESRATGLKHMP